MEYLINQTIHFNSTNGLINLIGNEKPAIQLSRPGSRLLKELVTNSGNTMMREELIKRVWEEHGLRPSGSSLSNHISLLRKVFSQLGMNENIIITIPKKGFRIDANVTLCQIHPPDEGNNITDITQFNKTSRSVLSCECKFTPTIKKAWLVLIALIIIIVTLNHTSLKSTKVDLFDIGTCRVIDLEKDNKRNREKKYEILGILINEKKIDCEKNKSTIYFRFTNVLSTKDYDKSAIFISQCHQSSNNSLTQCESYLSNTVKKP